MGRKSISVNDDAYDALAAHKADDESWSDLFERAAEALDSGESPDDGVSTDPGTPTVAVTNIDEIARATADEVENRMTRR